MTPAILFLVCAHVPAQAKPASPSLIAVLRDPAPFYSSAGSAGRVVVDVFLQSSARELHSVSFGIQVEPPLLIPVGGLSLSDGLFRFWGGCTCVAATRSDNGRTSSVALFGGINNVVVPIERGTLHLGHIPFHVDRDSETPQMARIRIGEDVRFSPEPPRANFGAGEVQLEPADELTITVQRRPFLRGDTNSDGSLDVADAVFFVQVAFLRGPGSFECSNAADANDDNALDISDPIFILNFLFLGGPPPAPPYPAPGYDRNFLSPERTGCAGF